MQVISLLSREDSPSPNNQPMDEPEGRLDLH